MSDDTAPTLTLGKVASSLDVHPRLLRRLVERFQFPPPVWIGGKERWCQRDVDSYLWLVTRGLLTSGTETSEPADEEV